MFGSKKRKKKHFKTQYSYLWSIILYVVRTAGCILTFFYFAGFSETEMKEAFLDQELVGSSSQRGAQGIQILLVKNFGKNGILGMLLIAIVVSLFNLGREIEEFFRYRKRLRLFKKGYNVDFINEKGKLRLFDLFQMSKRSYKNTKFDSSKKKQKEIEKSKLYKQLYGD